MKDRLARIKEMDAAWEVESARQILEENKKRAQKIINKIAEMRAQGAQTDDEIAAALNAAKFRHGFTKAWEGKQVQGMERWAQKKLGLEQRPLKSRMNT